MDILDLALSNFRNFSNKKIVFDKKITVILGPNGSGKSNVLEAISLLSGVRPLRVSTDLDLVHFGKSEAKIEGEAEDLERSKLSINFVVVDERQVRKSFLIDSIKKRFADFRGIFSIVVFHPQDLDLVWGSPSLRRHHIDTFLSSFDKQYFRDLSSYNKIVVRRNKVLARIADGISAKNELDFWDSRLLEHAKYITRARQDFFQFLNFLESVFGKEKKSYKWELKQSFVNGEKLARNRERDIAASVTLSGPHRDDFRFIFDNRDLSFFGSRGEQRMAVLALKLAQLEYLQIKMGSRPILALDDIFSELDWEHRDAVLSVVGKQQTLITAAEKESVPKELFKKAKVIEL